MSDQLELETKLAKEKANAEGQAYLEAEEDENPTSFPENDKPCTEQLQEDIQILPTRQKTKHFPPTLKATLPPHLERESNHLDLRDTANTMEQMLLQQQRHTLALMLPQPEVPTFDGNPIEYQNFIRAFETLIELKTDSDSTRLYYLIQYTASDVRELLKGCLSMNARDVYAEARRLLKQRYGQNYKIATAYMDRVTNGPSSMA